MRLVIPDVITPTEAVGIAESVDYIDLGGDLFTGIIAKIREYAPISIDPPSYGRVERRREGHPWHSDTGANGHMAWCEYSAGILLTDPHSFTGGGFFFQSDPTEPVFHYCDLILWSSGPENAHKVSSNSVGRISLIMFFGGSKNG